MRSLHWYQRLPHKDTVEKMQGNNANLETLTQTTPMDRVYDIISI